MTVARGLVGWLAGVWFGAAVLTGAAHAQGRGESLYATHCGTCHTEQMHWRARGAVKDWTSLKDEVRKWQVVASLGWTEDDVVDVARYLNDTIYHYEQFGERLTYAMQPARSPPFGKRR
jgi:mono/diheme cytochrome c family protein